MQHSALIKKGLRGGFIRFEDSAERRRVYYPFADQRFPLTPEEEVRIETYLHLILNLKYPPDHLAFEHKVKMGSSYKYVDIVFYGQKRSQDVRMIIECKRRDVSDRGFTEAVKQAKSYDRQLLSAEYLWITSGAKNKYYKASHAKRGRNYMPVPSIPRFTFGARLSQRRREFVYGITRAMQSGVGAVTNISLGKTGVFALLLTVFGFLISWLTSKVIVPATSVRLNVIFNRDIHYGYYFWGVTILASLLFLLMARRYALPNLFEYQRTDSRGRKRTKQLSKNGRFWRVIFITALLCVPTLLIAEALFGTEACAGRWSCWWSKRYYGSFDESWRMMEFFVPFSLGVPFQIGVLLLIARAREVLKLG